MLNFYIWELFLCKKKNFLSTCNFKFAVNVSVGHGSMGHGSLVKWVTWVKNIDPLSSLTSTSSFTSHTTKTDMSALLDSLIAISLSTCQDHFNLSVLTILFIFFVWLDTINIVPFLYSFSNSMQNLSLSAFLPLLQFVLLLILPLDDFSCAFQYQILLNLLLFRITWNFKLCVNWTLTCVN